MSNEKKNLNIFGQKCSFFGNDFFWQQREKTLDEQYLGKKSFGMGFRLQLLSGTLLKNTKRLKFWKMSQFQVKFLVFKFLAKEIEIDQMIGELTKIFKF